MSAEVLKYTRAEIEELEVAPGFTHDNLEGWIPALVNDADVRDALEKAFDYRGDIAITLKSGDKLEGYIFDRRTGAGLSDSYVRLYPKDSNEKRSVAYADIAALAFSGRDTAAGKSFEAWVRKYWEKKAAGEKNIGWTKVAGFTPVPQLAPEPGSIVLLGLGGFGLWLGRRARSAKRPRSA